MASKRRNQVSIVSDILSVCVNGATKAKIVQQANLNFSTVYPYLINLINKGLVEEMSGNSKIMYKTTSKGLEFKKKIEQSRTVMDEINSCV